MQPTDTPRRPLTLAAIIVASALALVALLGGSTAQARSAKAQVGFTARGERGAGPGHRREPGARATSSTTRAARSRSQTAGALGGVVFRDVEPGGGYRVRRARTARRRPRSRSCPTARRRRAPSSTARRIPASGYGYLTTRDGTQLAINVQLPGPAAPGPYPTLVEYSGYGYANPAGGESSIAQIANLLGYAVVDVNMRGTGCSGGAFDYFEPLQGLDGYDVIETVARQPWVAAPQGRDDGHLLRRHQPALRRRRPGRRASPRSRRCR